MVSMFLLPLFSRMGEDDESAILSILVVVRQKNLEQPANRVAVMSSKKDVVVAASLVCVCASVEWTLSIQRLDRHKNLMRGRWETEDVLVYHSSSVRRRMCCVVSHQQK